MSRNPITIDVRVDVTIRRQQPPSESDSATDRRNERLLGSQLNQFLQGWRALFEIPLNEEKPEEETP